MEHNFVLVYGSFSAHFTEELPLLVGTVCIDVGFNQPAVLTSFDPVGDGHEVEARARRAAVGARAVGAAHARPAVRVRLARLHLEQQLPQRRRGAFARDHAEDRWKQSFGLMLRHNLGGCGLWRSGWRNFILPSLHYMYILVPITCTQQ